MSELSDFFEEQDERRMEWECGARSPEGDYCAKPIDHAPSPHRTHVHAKVQHVWRDKATDALSVVGETHRTTEGKE